MAGKANGSRTREKVPGLALGDETQMKTALRAPRGDSRLRPRHPCLRGGPLGDMSQKQQRAL